MTAFLIIHHSILSIKGDNNTHILFCKPSLPAPDVFFAMPAQEEHVKILTAYDVLGFPTMHDRENFADCVARLGLGSRKDATHFTTTHHTFIVRHYLLGIKTDEFSALAEKAAATT